MKNLVISSSVMQKLLTRHHVSREEIIECFFNRTHKCLIDDREDHRSDPPTEWFISQTDKGRTLKIVFIMLDGRVHLRTAFEPKDGSDVIFFRHSKPDPDLS
ncbi:MAG: ADP-ribosyl-(dinitrogen reductase) hydrolase [Solimonas sp.]